MKKSFCGEGVACWPILSPDGADASGEGRHRRDTAAGDNDVVPTRVPEAQANLPAVRLKTRASEKAADEEKAHALLPTAGVGTASGACAELGVGQAPDQRGATAEKSRTYDLKGTIL
jgi:hypothetical protein